MAQMVMTNGGFKLATVDRSTYAASIVVNYSAEAPEATTFGKTTKVKLAGVKDWNADVGIVNDVSAAAIDDILFPLVGTLCAVEFYPNGTTASADNPKYSGNAVLTGWQPLNASHGEVIKSTVHFEGSDTLTRGDPT